MVIIGEISFSTKDRVVLYWALIGIYDPSKPMRRGLTIDEMPNKPDPCDGLQPRMIRNVILGEKND